MLHLVTLVTFALSLTLSTAQFGKSNWPYIQDKETNNGLDNIYNSRAQHNQAGRFNNPFRNIEFGSSNSNFDPNLRRRIIDRFVKFEHNKRGEDFREFMSDVRNSRVDRLGFGYVPRDNRPYHPNYFRNGM